MQHRIKHVEEEIRATKQLIHMIKRKRFFRICKKCSSVIHAAMMEDCPACGYNKEMSHV